MTSFLLAARPRLAQGITQRLEDQTVENQVTIELFLVARNTNSMATAVRWTPQVELCSQQHHLLECSWRLLQLAKKSIYSSGPSNAVATFSCQLPDYP